MLQRHNEEYASRLEYDIYRSISAYASIITLSTPRIIHDLLPHIDIQDETSCSLSDHVPDILLILF